MDHRRINHIHQPEHNVVLIPKSRGRELYGPASWFESVELKREKARGEQLQLRQIHYSKWEFFSFVKVELYSWSKSKSRHKKTTGIIMIKKGRFGSQKPSL